MANKIQVNIVLLGTSSGKSYLCGKIMHEFGFYKEQFEDLRKNYYHLGCEYILLMHKLKEEQEREISIECRLERFETSTHKITLIDTPGRKDYISNLIRGTYLADYAMLVVSSKAHEFENSIASGGTLLDQAIIARSMGIDNLLVVINKFDSSTYLDPPMESRYNEITKILSSLLKNIGFKEFTFLPLSAKTSDNLIENKNLEWFNGKTLIQTLETFQEPENLKEYIEKPLRIPIFQTFKISGYGTVCVGKIESGTIKSNTHREGCSIIKFAPINLGREARAIKMFTDFVDQGNVGDIVGVNCSLVFRQSKSSNTVHRGMVISSYKDHPARETESFVASITILNHPTKIKEGYEPIIHCHTSSSACKIIEILDKVDTSTGSIIPKSVDGKSVSLRKGDSAIVKFKPLKPIVFETYNDYKSLGRIVIVDGHLIGYGIILIVNHRKQIEK